MPDRGSEVGTVNQCETVTVLEYAWSSYLAQFWLLVETERGQRGWLSAEHIVFEQLPNDRPEQEQAVVLELLKNNRGCRLPCWWGITPSSTSWDTVQTHFASLGKTVRPRSSDGTDYSLDWYLAERNLDISQIYLLRDSTVEMIAVQLQTLRNRDRIYGDPRFAVDVQAYMLPQFLVDHGEPGEVYITSASSASHSEPIPFDVLLLYPGDGFMIDYAGLNEIQGDMIHLCPQTDVYIHLWLWPAQHALSLQEISRMNLGPVTNGDIGRFRPLEQVTSMTIETFYTTFRDVNNSQCLQTPKDLW